MRDNFLHGYLSSLEIRRRKGGQVCRERHPRPRHRHRLLPLILSLILSPDSRSFGIASPSHFPPRSLERSLSLPLKTDRTLSHPLRTRLRRHGVEPDVALSLPALLFPKGAAVAFVVGVIVFRGADTTTFAAVLGLFRQGYRSLPFAAGGGEGCGPGIFEDAAAAAVEFSVVVFERGRAARRLGTDASGIGLLRQFPTSASCVRDEVDIGVAVTGYVAGGGRGRGGGFAFVIGRFIYEPIAGLPRVLVGSIFLVFDRCRAIPRTPSR